MARCRGDSDQENLQRLGERGTQKKLRGSDEARLNAPRGAWRHVTDYSNSLMINSVCIDANNPAWAGHG